MILKLWEMYVHGLPMCSKHIANVPFWHVAKLQFVHHLLIIVVNFKVIKNVLIKNVLLMAGQMYCVNGYIPACLNLTSHLIHMVAVLHFAVSFSLF